MKQQTRTRSLLQLRTNTSEPSTSSQNTGELEQQDVTTASNKNSVSVDCTNTDDDLLIPERRSRSESDCDASGAFPGHSAGSSSNSSLSTRSLDSPSTSLEQVHPANANSSNASTSWDSDVDVEADPPDWSQEVSEEVLSNLTNTEKKRQEVINELFHTERSHVRALKVLSQVFHKPLVESQVLPMDQINLLFSNLDEMVTLHSQFNQAMKRKRKENPCVEDVGDLLLEMFDGESGEIFERAASTYCAKQQVALRSLRDQRRKDPKLNNFLNDIEANPLCRRLQLKDHILTGMLRLTKYPLLFENLGKYTPDTNEKEKASIIRSIERSKEILSRVNQAVKEAEDQHRLIDIQRLIDRSAFDKFEHPTVLEFKNLDITKRRLIYEGPLQWRVVKAKPVDLHVVLLDDTILLLHRQDDKYALKFINQMNSILSPIVKLSTVLVRHNAVDNNSLYLVNTSQNGAQIYDLVALSPAERKLWLKHISEAAELHKTRDREGRRPIPPSSSSNELNESSEDQLLPETDGTDKSDGDKRKEDASEAVDSSSINSTTISKQETHDKNKEASSEDSTKNNSNTQTPIDTKKNENEENLPTANESIRLVTCKCSIIEPVEVHVEERPVHIAEPVLTPIETLRRKDEIIKHALLDKQSIVASILNIPKTQIESLGQTSRVDDTEKQPRELILTAIDHANQLVELLNSALTVSESDIVLASQNPSTSITASCEVSGCPASSKVYTNSLEPSITVSALQPVCNTLVSNLSQLLKIVNERDEERENLKKELRRSRERLHAIDAEAQRREVSGITLTKEETTNEAENDQISETADVQISKTKASSSNTETDKIITTATTTTTTASATPTTTPATITPTTIGTKETNDETNQEVFMNAESQPEPAPTNTFEDTKVSSDKEVMGDSAG